MKEQTVRYLFEEPEEPQSLPDELRQAIDREVADLGLRAEGMRGTDLVFGVRQGGFPANRLNSVHHEDLWKALDKLPKRLDIFAKVRTISVR